MKITQIKDSIILVRNQSDKFPITDLSKTKIAALHIGQDSVKTFQHRLDDYASITHYHLQHESDFQKFHQDILDYQLIIVGYYKNGLYSSTLGYLNDWQEDIPIVHVVMQDQSFFDQQDQFQGSNIVIHANGNSRRHQDLAGQAVFGGVDLYDTEHQLVSKSNRLGFVLPEELGIDGEKLEHAIDSIVNEGLRSNAFPGCQILAAKDGKVFFHKTYGYHTYDSLITVGKEDIYDLASVTKVTAATAGLMKLHDDGLFDLDVPAKTYWPDFKWTRKANLTFRAILAHNARLKSWIPYWKTAINRWGNYRFNTLSKTPSNQYPTKLTDELYLHRNYQQKIYRKIKYSKLNEQPGYVYSGLSFYLYPEIISELSGKTYENFLKEQFYEPLGANTLTFNAGRQYPLERIIPTEVDTFFRKTTLHGVVHDEGAAMMDGVSGNAGLFGKAIDVAKMWQMLLNMGTYGGKQYLSHHTVRKFTSCQYCEQGNRRGLGFDKPLIQYHPQKSSVAEAASPDSFGHSGYTGTFVWADPANGLLFIFLSNRVHPTRDNRKIYELNIRPGIHTVLYDVLD